MSSIPTITDPRVSSCKANVNGKTYSYILGMPKGEEFKATIVLVHGFPDLGTGWRYQIPMLIDLGLRVVVPDMMGYGGTDAPKCPPEPIAYYGFKRAAQDIKELAKQLGAENVILGGHDWGGAVVYRVALWYPDFVTHLFSVCTPYWTPSKDMIPLEDLVRTRLPNFGYQLQFKSGEIEKKITSRDQIRQLLNGAYGGRSPDGSAAFEVQKGLDLEKLEGLEPTPLVNAELLDYYVDQYARNGMYGPLSWYRTREINFQQELELEKTTIDVPVLFIMATKDSALPPAMSAGMEESITDLTRRQVDTDHWALWQAPDRVNGIVRSWLEDVVLRSKSSL